MENKNWWEQATAADNNKDVAGNKVAWYNQKSKLGASILLWPLWLYGMYKTELYTRKTKVRWVAAILVLAAIYALIATISEQN